MAVFAEAEWFVLLGAGLWVGCGGMLGYFAPDRIPREFSLLFILLGMIGGGIGLSVWLPDAQTVIIVEGSAISFAALPLLFSAYLFWVYPKGSPPSQPRGMGKRGE